MAMGEFAKNPFKDPSGHSAVEVALSALDDPFIAKEK